MTRKFDITIRIEEPNDIDLVNDLDTLGDRLKHTPTDWMLLDVEEVK